MLAVQNGFLDRAGGRAGGRDRRDGGGRDRARRAAAARCDRARRRRRRLDGYRPAAAGLGVALAAAMTAGLALAEALTGGSAAVVLAAMLLCVLLGLVAYFLKLGRASQEATELLFAQLEDAREEQLQAAAVRERGRIASRAARRARPLTLRRGDPASRRPEARRARAGELADADRDRARQRPRPRRSRQRPAGGRRAPRRRAVRASRTSTALVARFNDDTADGRDADRRGRAPAAAGRGKPRALPRRPGGAHECRPLRTGRHDHVVLRYGTGVTSLTVEDRLAAPPASAAGLADVGGGNGLNGMRERLERVGGRMHAGPTARRLAGRAGGACVIRVLVADDQRVVREGLATLVGLIDDIEVVGTAATVSKRSNSRANCAPTSC